MSWNTLVMKFLKFDKIYQKADFGNFGGHFGVLRLDLDHGFLITFWSLWWVESKSSKIYWLGVGEDTKIQVAQTILKHILVLEFLKFVEIL